MKSNNEKRLPYEKPKVLASYQKEELETIIQPHGQNEGECPVGGCPTTGGGGCGCGGGSGTILRN